MEATNEITAQFCREQLAHYDAKELDKEDSKLMQLFGDVLEKLGIQDKPMFMQLYITTVDLGPAGKFCYTPKPFGSSGDPEQNISDICVCTHETQHLHDAKVHGFAQYGIAYLAHTADRNLFEAGAIAAAVEVYFYLRGRMPDVAWLVSTLKHYGLTDEHVEVARGVVASVEPTLRAGGVSQPAAQVAIRWLQKNAPGLAAQPELAN